MPTTLCLDLGTAHTGIAISYEGILAEPLATIFESKLDKLIGKLIPYIAKINPETIVIGVPDHGPLVKYANDFKAELEKIFSGDIVFFSEDLSSRSAKTILKDTGKTLARRKIAEHQTAAAIILQEFLDS
jgi:putative transcription antitermination factor YqgF